MLLKLNWRSVLGWVLVGLMAISLEACSAISTLPASNPSSGAAVERVKETGGRTDFPPALGETLRQDLANRANRTADQFQVVKASRQTWPNGCLGLAKPEEFCAEMVVEGWQIKLSDGKQQWVYHTDRSGQNYRIQTP